MENLHTLTLSELSLLLGSGQLSSEELVTTLLERANSHRDLNAFITLNGESALQQAIRLDEARAKGLEAGLLHGLPIVVKDNIHVSGLANTAGTKGLDRFIPECNSPVVQRLLEQGAIILGKTNMHELAFGITGANSAYGTTLNPRDRTTFAGGSSGGTAAAIAACLAPAGLGTDTGGSVRIPAALTGIIGYRPSSGRYSLDGITPLSKTLDTVGLMAHSLGDIKLLDQVITRLSWETPNYRPRDIRLGVPDYYYDNLDRRVTAAMCQVHDRLSRQGIKLVREPIPGLAQLIPQTAPLVPFETINGLKDYLHKQHINLSLAQLIDQISSPDVQQIFKRIADTESVTVGQYQTALKRVQEVRNRYREYLQTHRLDAVLFPTTPLPAGSIEKDLETVTINGRISPTFPTYVHNTLAGSLAGAPGISLPLIPDDARLPIGLEIDGGNGKDPALFGVARVIQDCIADTFYS